MNSCVDFIHVSGVCRAVCVAYMLYMPTDVTKVVQFVENEWLSKLE
jgi:hypothetical protein